MGQKIFDKIIITVSNKYQKQVLENEIERREGKEFYTILEEKQKLGSGGGLWNVIRKLGLGIEKHKILLINSAGESKRMILYADKGKVCIPTFKKIGKDIDSILLDDILLETVEIGKKMQSGILIVSGDCITKYKTIETPKIIENTAFSVKVKPEIGQRHGVFLVEKGELIKTLQKKPKEELEKIADKNENVNIDTGMVYLDHKTVSQIREIELDQAIPLDFYTDFMYPLAKETTLEEYLKQVTKPEELKIKKQIWKALRGQKMKVLLLKEGEFVHYGTNKEFREEIKKITQGKYLLKNTKVLSNVKISKDCYLENSILEDCEIGENTIIVDSVVFRQKVPSNVLIKTFSVKKGYVSIILGFEDNVKEERRDETTLFGKKVDLKGRSLWNSKIFCIKKTKQEAFEEAIKLYER